MTAKWTPGPWEARQLFSGHWHITAEGGNGMTLASIPAATEEEDNARLIAAAPELAEALANLANMVSGRPTSDFQWAVGEPDRIVMDRARAALAAAGWEDSNAV